MAEEIKRKYIVPLRKEFRKAPNYRKAHKAVKALREFLAKHMKSDNVKLGDKVNEHIWRHGIKNPPGKVEVNVTKKVDGTVQAELVGHEFVEKKKVEKKEKGKLEKLTEKITGKKSEDLPAQKKKTEVKETPKTEEKKEAPKVEEKPAEKPKAEETPKKEE